MSACARQCVNVNEYMRAETVGLLKQMLGMKLSKLPRLKQLWELKQRAQTKLWRRMTNASTCEDVAEWLRSFADLQHLQSLFAVTTGNMRVHKKVVHVNTYMQTQMQVSNSCAWTQMLRLRNLEFHLRSNAAASSFRSDALGAPVAKRAQYLSLRVCSWRAQRCRVPIRVEEAPATKHSADE